MIDGGSTIKKISKDVTELATVIDVNDEYLKNNKN
jgi:hypothetical protein